MEKVKVSREVAKALNDLRHDKRLDNSDIFFRHRAKLQEGGWRARLYEPLNNISLDAMYEILEWGYEANTDRPTPKTPRQMGAQIVRLTQPNARCQVHPIVALHQKEKQQQSTAEALQAELDYELASLSHAITNNDAQEVERSKRRLAEIHEELEGLGC